MLTIDTVILGAVLGLAAFGLKIWVEMKNGLKESMSSEAAQNANITNCNHRIELLQHKIDAELDRTELITNGLLERITHNRQRLEARLNEVESYMNKNSDFVTRNRKE